MTHLQSRHEGVCRFNINLISRILQVTLFVLSLSTVCVVYSQMCSVVCVWYTHIGVYIVYLHVHVGGSVHVCVHVGMVYGISMCTIVYVYVFVCGMCGGGT